MVTTKVIPVLPEIVGEPPEYNTNYVLFWNDVALDCARLSTSSTIINANGNNPVWASRFLAIVHIAINDAYFSIYPDSTGVNTTYLTPNASDAAFNLPPTDGAEDAEQAVAGAALTVLNQLYLTPAPQIPFNTIDQFSQLIQQHLDTLPLLDTLSLSYRFGVAVANAILSVLDQGPGPFLQGNYRPTPGQYKFDDDPTNPIRIVPVNPNFPNGPQRAIHIYASPFYGLLGKRIAVQGVVDGVPVEHIIADPPVGFSTNNVEDYQFAFEEVYHEGGATGLNTTTRQPDQQENAYFWAYDGSNLIGTPPRHYNQILRKVAVDKRPATDLRDEANNADFVRVFALANAAMGDSGLFAWLEKYCYEFWRPLSGVRQDLTNPLVDIFWLSLSAPETNTDEVNFKPPFPSYPSGHATFGGAFFQILRLYYKRRDNLSFADDEADEIAFSAATDELNGISRDLRQKYVPTEDITDQLGIVRTNVGFKSFPSFWTAMFSNAISRVFLGVHWGFDAFAQEDVLASRTFLPNGTVDYKDPQDITYITTGGRGDRPAGEQFPIGGVPLGIGIANDIFQSNLKPTPPDLQPSGRKKCGDPLETTSKSVAKHHVPRKL